MKTKRHGWVLRDKNNGRYAMEIDGIISVYEYAGIKKAGLIGSRSDARIIKEGNETVVKVALTKNGRPYKVIGRG